MIVFPITNLAEALIKHSKRKHKVPRLRKIAEKRQFRSARDDKVGNRSSRPGYQAISLPVSKLS
jgi:hypothetical protein